jgi:hypothetical protein
MTTRRQLTKPFLIRTTQGSGKKTFDQLLGWGSNLSLAIRSAYRSCRDRGRLVTLPSNMSSEGSKFSSVHIAFMILGFNILVVGLTPHE